MKSDKPEPYKLSMTSAAKNDLRRVFAAANVTDTGAEMIAAARDIEERLLTDPMEAGEPLYELGPPKILIRVLPIRPLAAEYGVMEEQRAVCIRSFRSMQAQAP